MQSYMTMLFCGSVIALIEIVTDLLLFFHRVPTFRLVLWSALFQFSVLFQMGKPLLFDFWRLGLGFRSIIHFVVAILSRWRYVFFSPWAQRVIITIWYHDLLLFLSDRLIIWVGRCSWWHAKTSNTEAIPHTLRGLVICLLVIPRISWPRSKRILLRVVAPTLGGLRLWVLVDRVGRVYWIWGVAVERVRSVLLIRIYRIGCMLLRDLIRRMVFRTLLKRAIYNIFEDREEVALIFD